MTTKVTKELNKLSVKDSDASLAQHFATVVLLLRPLLSPTPSTSTSSPSTSSSPVTTSSIPPTLTLLRTELLSLLPLLSREATSLSLALKPPISLAAAQGTLVKIGELVNKVAFWRTVVEDTGTAKSALRGELLTASIDFLTSYHTLLQHSLSSLPLLLSPASSATLASRKSARDQILALTGAVWETAEAAKGTSESEWEAEKKEWRGTRGLLEDWKGEVEDDLLGEESELSDEEKKGVHRAVRVVGLAEELLEYLVGMDKPEGGIEKQVDGISDDVGRLSELADDVAGVLDEDEETVEQSLGELFFSSLPTLTQYCLIGQKCYPTHSEISAFNHSVHGRAFIPPTPDYFCEKTQPTSDCTNATWRDDQPWLLQYVEFETGLGIGETGQTNETEASVGRGRVPALAVAVETAQDVSNAVRFARRHSLRLRVKNTGHDFLGRSSDVGSFTISTHLLTQTEFVPKFVPEGAPKGYAPVKALWAGSGVQVLQLYETADKLGVIIPGGVSGTVGATGGFLLGGGHGPFGPLHGLLVDSVLQFTVVDSLGFVRTVSEFSHPDLFTALRGGGGGFGVVVDVVIKTHEPPAGFVGILGEFGVKEGAPEGEWTNVVREWVKLQPQLSAAAPFAGYSYVTTTMPTPFAYILPSNDVELAKASFKPFTDYVAAHADALEFNITFVEEDTWFKLWAGPFTTALEGTDAVGLNLLVGSRLIPKTVVEDDGDALADWLSTSPVPSIVHLVAGRAVSEKPAFPTSVNPLWREALLHIDFPGAWAFNATDAQVQGVRDFLVQHTLALGQIAQFGNGAQAAYSSESCYDEASWQDVLYGETYSSLLAAKFKWDPTGVFSARHYPGSEFIGY
ncbi:FAD linked oxidase [Pseudohyphozyma bogoriensis]|nr:FAD linked oxidase [Pseudohyphozyma bogoriensis]